MALNQTQPQSGPGLQKLVSNTKHFHHTKVISTSREKNLIFILFFSLNVPVV